MLIKIWHTFKILLTGQIKAAWWYFTFVGQEKIGGLKKEDFEVDYLDEDLLDSDSKKPPQVSNNANN